MSLIQIVTLAYLAGTLAGKYDPLPWWGALAAGAATGALAMVYRKKEIVFIVFISILSFSTSLLLYQSDRMRENNNPLVVYLKAVNDPSRLEMISGTVIDSREERNGDVSVVVSADSVRVSPETVLKVKGDVLVSWKAELGSAPLYGERWRIEGWMKPADAMKPRARIQYRINGINARMYPARGGARERMGEGRLPILMKVGSGLRQKFLGVLEERIHSPYNQLIGKMLLGKGQDMDDEIQEQFRLAGLTHILVVSGMNVWFMLGTFIFLSVFWNRHPTVSFIVLSIVLLTYFAVTGGGPSITRATIMGFVFLIALLFGSDYHAKTALWSAGLMMMVMNPLSIYQVGAQLSFIASAGVIYIYPELAAYTTSRGFRGKVLTALLVTISAQLPLYPVLAYYFNQFCLIAPISNLVVVPLAALAFPIDIATCVAGLIPGPLAAAPAFFAELAARLMLALTKFFAYLPFSNIEVASPPFLWILVFEAAIVFFILALRWSREGPEELISPMAVALCCCCAILIMPYLWRPPLSAIQATFMDVGEGDSTLVELPLESHGAGVFRVLVDAGGSWGKYEKYFDPGERVVGARLRKSGIRRLDAVIMSHADADHLNGLSWIIENVKVDRFIDVGAPPYVVCRVFGFKDSCEKDPGEYGMKPSQAARYESLLRNVKKRGVEYIPLRAGLAIKLKSGAEIRALSPVPGMIDAVAGENGLNNMSGIVKIIYGKGSLLLTGDSKSELETQLVETYGDSLKSSLLKAPHHGSRTSSSIPYLKKVMPDAVVIMTGGPMFYGHPHRDTLMRYREINASVWRTDESGTVTCRIAGSGGVSCKPEFSEKDF